MSDLPSPDKSTSVDPSTVESSAAGSHGSELTTARLDFPLWAPGQIVDGRYEVLERLGEGGMSSVFLCRHKSLDELLAIKILQFDRSTVQTSLRRFEQEAKATIKLNHPNLIKLIDYNAPQEGLPYIVMEYVKGKTLSDVIYGEGTLSPERFVKLFSQICDGLHFAHTHGVVHRDLKPENLMITQLPDGSENVKIVDFGIARIERSEKSQQVTQTGDIFGSPLYMSPEQCRGEKPDQRSDLYSLGCVMFESLTGAPPFRGDSAMQTMFMHVSAKAPAVKLTIANDESHALVKIIECLMSKDRNQRMSSALEVKEALAGTLKSEAHSKSTRSGSSAKKLPLKLSLIIPAIVAVSLVILIGSVLFLNTKFREHNSASPMQSSKLPANSKESTSQKRTLKETVAGFYDAAVKYQNERETRKAEEACEKALAMADKSLDKRSTTVRKILMSYGNMVFTADDGSRDYSHAARLFEKAEPLLDVEPPIPPDAQSNVYGSHGVSALYLKKYGQAYDLFDTAQSEAAKEPPGSDRDVKEITWLTWKGNARAKQNRLSDALRLYRQAEAIAGKDHPVELCGVLRNKATTLWDADQKDVARGTLKSALQAASEGKLSDTNPDLIEIKKLIAQYSDKPEATPR